MQLYQDTVQDRNGNVITGVSIAVKTYPGLATATIYDSAGVATTNPLTSDSDGSYEFAAAGGAYQLTYTKPGITTESKVISLEASVSVKDAPYYATGDGSTDDTVAIQAAITANAGKTIYFPAGTYKTTGVINITSDYTRLVGAGSGATQIRMYTSTTADQFKFSPAGALATDGTKLAQNGIFGMYIYRFTNGTAGAAIHCVQCTGFQMDDVRYLDYPEGLKVLGGTLNNFTGFTGSATDNLTGAPVSGSSLLSFTEAPLDGGLYQIPYTTTVSNFRLTGTRHIDAQMIVRACDGLGVCNGYISNGYNANIRIKTQTAAQYVSGLTFTNIYVDGVVMSTSGTIYGLDIPADSLGTSYVYDVGFSNCYFSNAQTSSVFVSEGFSFLSFVNCRFANTRGWAIDITGSNTFSNLIISGCQIKDAGAVTASKGGISVSTLLNCTITGNQFKDIAATGTGTAIVASGTNVNGCFLGNEYYNCTTNITNSATWTKLEGLSSTFTPTLTFATAGDLSVAYSTRVGRSTTVAGMTTAFIFITTSTFTYTTASGNLTISGLPTALTSSGSRWTGTVQFNGLNLQAGYTQLAPYMLSGGSSLTISMSGDNVGIGSITTTEAATASTIILNLQITYETPL